MILQDLTWNSFDGQYFQALIQDLLVQEGYEIEASGVGPDGGVDLIATKKSDIGFHNADLFSWAVQCKFKEDINKSVYPSEIENVLNVVNNERFKAKKISGYILVTNANLSTNLISEIRGLNNSIPGFKTGYLDKSDVFDLLIKHFKIYNKYFHPFQRRKLHVDKTLKSEFFISASNELEALINNEQSREVDFNVFFETYPEVLLKVTNREDCKVLTQPELFSDKYNWIADFIICGDYYNRPLIVEARKPNENIVVKIREASHYNFSQKLTRSLHQLQDYCGYFESEERSKYFAEMYDTKVVNPEMCLIMGFNNFGDLTLADMKSMCSKYGVLFLSYDEILYRLRNQ